jgi:hypothetical protein
VQGIINNINNGNIVTERKQRECPFQLFLISLFISGNLNYFRLKLVNVRGIAPYKHRRGIKVHRRAPKDGCADQYQQYHYTDFDVYS